LSAGFDFGGQVHWGTNGAIEAYLESMVRIGYERLGRTDPVPAALDDELVGFFPGKVILLDPILRTTSDREHFIQLLDAATLDLEWSFTDLGRRWIATEIRELRARIVSSC